MILVAILEGFMKIDGVIVVAMNEGTLPLKELSRGTKYCVINLEI